MLRLHYANAATHYLLQQILSMSYVSHHDDHGLFPVQPVYYCEGQSLQTYSALDQKELVTIIDVDSQQPIIQVKVITYKQKNSNNSLANKSLISNFH